MTTDEHRAAGEVRVVARATICRQVILPAALIAKQARWCRLCAPISTQRSRAGR